jgi:NADPH-dependent 2,4-dienoyl-CoA reductase/sulfur reductase-like enzyme
MRRVRHADVVVIGAGPAGLTAASAAAERGKSVLLVDQGLRPGGQVWRHRDEQSLPGTARRLMARARSAGVKLVSSCRFVDAASPNELIIDFRGRIDRHRTDAVIIATGARERFIPFPGWTLPGVTGVGGLQALIKGGLPLANTRVVLAGSGPLLFPVAAAVARAGGRVQLVGEQTSGVLLRRFAIRVLRDPAKLRQAISSRWAFRNAPFRADTWAVRANGDVRLHSVELSERGRPRTIRCDWLGVGAGLVPNTDLAELLRCRIVEGAIAVDHHQATSLEGVWAAGECTGVKGDDAAIAEGEIAGRAAAGDSVGAGASALQAARAAGRIFRTLLEETFAVRSELLTLATPDTIVCRCEDVPRGAIDPTWTQRQAKLWTRLGMGACQGAVCGPACTALFGWRSNAVRPPLGAPSCGEWMSGLKSLD